MEITLEQYILNPQIKSNAVLNATAREAIRNSYKQKFDAVMMREHGRFEYSLFYDKKSNRYFAHIKVPSEVIVKFYYDTVIEFYTDANISNTEDLLKYKVRFYSNDPAFVYTHAYSFSQNNLFINELSSKMSKKALHKEAKEKNPNNQIGYVKSIYFAYLYIKEKGLNNRSKFEGEAKKFSRLALASDITDADTKVADREAEGDKLNKLKKKNKPQQKESKNISLVKPSLKIKSTKTTGTVKSVKTSRTIKRK